MTLVDQFNRKVNYLRISITDRCDLRCVYCMKEKMTFLPKKEILTIEEIERLCDNFIEMGVKKIRLTGGEPLVRKGIIDLIKKLNMKKDKTNLNEIALTTNGTLLQKFAKDLKQNGINRINVSLDTINEKKYNEITRFGNLNKVFDGIKEAISQGIKIKINTVVIKNFNENELSEILIWANKLNIDVTFIEVMPMEETDTNRYMQYAPLDKIYNNLNKQFSFKKIAQNTGGPAIYYTGQNISIKVGFITPITNNFCESCNRVRITSTGKLYMCLGQNDHIDFKEILRNDFSNDYIKEKIEYALKIKPKKHDFLIDKNIKPYMQRHMNVTGG